MAKVVRFNLKNFLNYHITYIEENKIKIIFRYIDHSETEFYNLGDNIEGYSEIKFRRSTWIIFYEADDILKERVFKWVY